MVCPRCQQENSVKAKYCQNCGRDFTKEDRQTARQGGQQPQYGEQPPQYGEQPPQYGEQPPQYEQFYYAQQQSQGQQFPQQGYPYAQQPININVINTNTNTNAMGGMYSTKSKVVTLVLCLLLGWLGIHRFYTGKIMTGLLWFFTLGLCGVGVLVDFIFILTGAFRDKSGLPLQ